uniref:Uncharacterized protein n=1 Tax=Grammatophora oceanica TaxID=210454 RepID=A0A7S1Y5X5_9STRA|mmetsp:Transcript_24146/g.35562  ORF Transcript_24146/g.35562 Transcript_24146/m.35562 type:complete len:101 (+) Transcript_24146:506-808(+)
MIRCVKYTMMKYSQELKICLTVLGVCDKEGTEKLALWNRLAEGALHFNNSGVRPYTTPKGYILPSRDKECSCESTPPFCFGILLVESRTVSNSHPFIAHR